MDKITQPLHEMLREKNEEAYLALRLAEPKHQAQMMAVFVVFHEAYEAYTATTDAMVAKIKIAWWRERIEEVMQGTQPRPHPALLALGDDFEHYDSLLKILDEFENVIDGWQPKNFTEIALFISKTFASCFAICGKICGAKNAEELGFAYGNLFLLRKFQLNNNMFQGSSEIAKTAEKNFTENILLIPEGAKNSAFALIIKHYTSSAKPKRWKLLLKMFFQAKSVF